MRKFTINLVIPSFYPAFVYGGPIFSSLFTCEALVEFDEIDVRVSTTNANMDSKLDVRKNQWVVFKDSFFVKYYNETIIGKFSVALFFNIWKDIRSADVVYIQGVFSSPTPISLIYAKSFGKPILLSPRGSLCEWGLNQGSKFKLLWLRCLIQPFSGYVFWHATSEQEKKDILKQFPKANIFVVANGTDLDSYSKANFLERNAYVTKYIGKNILPTKIIVSMGRLHKIKGFDILINSFAGILPVHPNALLLIAGKDVGEQAMLEKLIAEIGLENKVFFVGELLDQDKVDFLANADLFVLPSHTENFGNVYIESLASGTPIVASTGTPWSEVESADCGKWVDNSVEDTARAMLEMLHKDRGKMCVNARKFAEKYDWKNVALQLKRIFEEIAK